jgi:arylsulfatase A-like enzyme
MFIDKEPPSRWPAEGRLVSPAEGQLWADAYDGGLTFLDDRVGRLLADLERRKLLENTLVIVTADHGEQFGEHGLVDHGNSLYRPLLHVPLVVSFPGRAPSGKIVEAPVTLRDLPSTILELARVPHDRTLPGKSLSRHWTNTTETSDAKASPVLSEVRYARGASTVHPLSRGDMASLVENGYHYIRNGADEEELYDFQNDPDELRNLSKDPQHRLALERLRGTLQGLMREDRTID